MSKTKTAFFCQNCGTQYPKWQGQCTSCRQWNTIVEEIVQKEEKLSWKSNTAETKKAARPLRVAEIDSALEFRLPTGDGELDLTIFEGVSSGLLGDDEYGEAGGVLEPGSSAALLIYENSWATPFANALRNGGAQVIAAGFIPHDELAASLDLADAAGR